MTVLAGFGTHSRTVSVLAPRATLVTPSGIAVLVSLLPSLLPRPAFVQGLLTGILLMTAVGLDAAVRQVSRRRMRPAGELLRWLVLAGAVGAVSIGAYAADHRLDASRADLGLSSAGDTYWLMAVAVAVITSLTLMGAAKGLIALGRRLRSRRVQLAVVAAVAVTAVVGPGAADAGWETMAAARDIPYVLTETSPVAGSVRIYVGLGDAGTPEARADLAVARLEASGGLDKSAIVLAFPTGTGWVNPFAVNAFEDRRDGDLATVAMQAGYAPSWVEMFLHRAEQEASARALYEAVSSRLAALPAEDRPRLYLYGESLGALVGQSVVTHADRAAGAVCAAVWAGVPGNSTLGMPGEVVHRNPDDPVVRWRPGVIFDRPDTWPGSVWIPGVSYLTTTLDLITSLGSPPGHGHVYGPEQAWRLPRECA